jgi:hypothetical protein
MHRLILVLLCAGCATTLADAIVIDALGELD